MIGYASGILRWTPAYKGGIFRKIKSAVNLLADLIASNNAEPAGLSVTEGGLTREKIAENAGRMLDKYGDSILRLSYS